ncbi:DUF3488 and transglutaminase-like domain-containing protein [Methylobacillus gramineus]|uniref:transglutaminase TgpA family protein n=1 Tax=Methylobacillus gramineus TaxID=755169 RepID=UPI001CFFE2F1|nr:DUF3488 and transglutaminase-like domain-containing protein [Methylobacillus gramineus]MCB5184685.1 DUF3488 and transglutaminase-like domain-containing protein [Methylobacillus gramineus]
MSRAINPGMADLRWLLLSMCLAMALHIDHFPVWVSALIALFMGWRYLLERNHWAMPKLWILVPITLFGVVGILVTYRSLFGRDASVAMLALMLALKLMESSTRRDYVILGFAGYFMTITAFLFNQSLLVGAYLLLPLAGFTATLVGISYPHGTLSQRLRTRIAGSLLLQSIPIMLILFLLFPRIPGPLWGVPQDAYRSMSGLSDNMEPGNISDLSLSAAIAFRVQFKGEIPAPQQLYWRGPVLWHFDGRGWHMDNNRTRFAAENLLVSGDTVDYTVTLEPHNRQWLLMLDIPQGLPAEAYRSREWQVLTRNPVRTRIRYEGSSHTSYQLALDLDDRARQLALALPASGNPRSRELAQQWHDQLREPQQIVNAALELFRQQPFIYTLAPPRLGRDSIDDFLFNTKRGFCEHYASSFTYLMRAAGVPARVVTGYQGGEVNPVGQYLIVRQSDAHAWAEVWLPKRGWVRVDPTAAVSPSRVETGISTALPDNTLLPLMARPDYPWLRNLYLNWDAVNNGWNQWVLGYNQQRQLELLSRLSGTQVNWQDLVLWLMGSLATFILLLCLFLFRRVRQSLDPVQVIYRRYLRKLARHGIRVMPHEGAQDVQHRASQQFPQHAVAIARITDLYQSLRYGADAEGKTMAELRTSINKLKL